MKLILVISLFLLSLTSSASMVLIEINKNTEKLLPAFILECKDVGLEKVASQAESYGVEVDMSTFRITDISKSMLAKYIWWAVDITDVNGRTDVFPENRKPILQVLTQKPQGCDCF